MNVRTYRKIHRWLGLVVGIQLLLWTAGGLFFSLNPIAKVRGESEAPEPAPLAKGDAVRSPAGALAQLVDERVDIEFQTILLRPHLEGSVYEIAFVQNGEEHWALADPGTGLLRPPVDQKEALEIARRAYLPEATVATIEMVTSSEPGSEYRERPLPAFRITFDDALGTRLYVSVERGIVTARRNDRWRLFDLMWMLHIMDYQHRDNFNTLVLQTVSALGLVTVLSGFVLAATTSPRIRRIVGRD